MKRISFRRILVVLSPNALHSRDPGNSATLARAAQLAAATGAELQLFHVCQDAALEQGLFAADQAVRAERQLQADRDATRLAELALQMEETAGSKVSHDVRWDHPRTDAILRKIHDYQPDMVMKDMQGHYFFIGLLSNADWDLIRRSSAHLWFVREGVPRPSRLVTAVGSTSNDEEIISAPDYAVFRVACLIADAFGAENLPVHAYQAPQINAYWGYAPDIGMVNTGGVMADPLLKQFQEDRRAVARKHGRQIRAFAEYFHLDPEVVHIESGHPGDVLPRAAGTAGANVIVMGARNLGRWERVLHPVTAEPVLAEAPCDVIFVKEKEGASMPIADEVPAYGVPVIDVEKAIVDPEGSFGSPAAVAGNRELSADLRRRILAAWEQDVRARMVEDDEGGPVTGAARNADVIEKINSARALLRAEGNNSGSTGPQPEGHSSTTTQKRRFDMAGNFGNSRDEFIQKMKAKLDVLNTEMAKLEKQAAEARGDAKTELDKELKALQQTRKDADEKLKSIRQSSDEAWDDVKEGAESAWRSLSDSVERATQRFQ